MKTLRDVMAKKYEAEMVERAKMEKYDKAEAAKRAKELQIEAFLRANPDVGILSSGKMYKFVNGKQVSVKI